MFKFSGKAVHVVSQYRSIGDIRFYLQGVYAEPAPGGGAFLVASCGHQMAIYYDKEAICSEPVLFKITPQAVAALKPNRRVYNQVVEINPVTQRLIVMGSIGINVDPHEELYLQPGKCFIEGKFPDWKRVLKPLLTGAAVETACVNSKYLAHFYKTVSPHVKYSDAKMFFTSERNGIVMRNTEMSDFLAIVMPMHMENIKRAPDAIYRAAINHEEQQ